MAAGMLTAPKDRAAGYFTIAFATNLIDVVSDALNSGVAPNRRAMDAAQVSNAAESPERVLSQYRQRAWLIVAVLFLEVLFTFGAAVGGHGPWVGPLMKRYSMTHASIARLFATVSMV